MSKVVKILKGHPLLVVVVVGVIAYALFGDKLPHLDLENLLDDVSTKLGKLTYLLVAVLAFLETGAFVGLVFPGETAVIIAGAVAGQGETSIILTIAIVWFSAWLGDTASFFIGRKLGREFILRHGPKVRITEARFEQVEGYFQDHGGKTILVGRFIGLVRALAPFIAGSSGMRYRAFVPYSILGTGLWATAFSLLGYFLSSSIGKAGEYAKTGSLVFGVTVAVLVVVFLVVRTLRHSERRSKLARDLERYRLGRPLVAFGRRIEPQARFLWERVTPGGLGLELTSLLAALAVASFVVVGYAIVVSGTPGPTGGDNTAIDAVGHLRVGWMTSLMKGVTWLGSAWATIPVALIAIALLWRSGHKQEALAVAAALIFSHVASTALKDVVDRPRPSGGLIATPPSASYPSGHSSQAVLYPALAIIAAVRLRPGKAGGAALVLAGVAIAVLIAFSRVYLGVHYFSDVSGGLALGVFSFALSAAVAMIVSHLRDNPRQA
ncbi:hypothetical protein BH10ACT11_BH10ACT11_06350 [soil metagenome]